MSETLLHSKTVVAEPYLSRNQAIAKMNHNGSTGTAFFFLISYNTEKTVLIENPLSSNDSNILFSFPNDRNDQKLKSSQSSTSLAFEQPSSKNYGHQFRKIQEELHKGNIYLLNLTQSTRVQCEANLQEIFSQAKAKYKVYYPGHFVLFSPETFVRIQQNMIYTYPMKGTIRTDVPDALENLRNDPKEQAEHASVVDLLRNDLGQVAQSVRVSKYRYFEKVKAGKYELWQASSEIEGSLPAGYTNSLGDLIFTLLPAGSITGVPKKNAVSIIHQVENHDRGFYTGICGYFDGKNLDSSVMIRFIERTTDGLVYKSGGGIHQMSNMKMEYDELIQKIYVPVY